MQGIGESECSTSPSWAAIWIYSVYDSFGKKAMYVAAPIIVVGLYLLLPAELNTDDRMR